VKRNHLSLLCAVFLLAAPAARAAEAGAATPDASSSGGDQIVEGELSNLGSMKLALKDTRIGLLVGPSLIGTSVYLNGALEFDMQFGKIVGFGLAAPVNFLFFDPKAAIKNKKLAFFPNGLALRKEDYNAPAKFVRLVRYLTIGHKEGQYFVNLASDYAATIGHGAAIRRYAENINLNDARLLGEVDAKFQYGGFELMVGNVVSPLNLMGALLYLKPLGGMQSLLAQKLSIGVEYAGDFYAPYEVTRGASGYPVLDPTGTRIEVAPSGTGQVHIPGISIETKVVKTDNVDVKPYIDVSKMFASHAGKPLNTGMGVTVGALGRFGFGGDIHNALRVIAEGRVFQNNYRPAYFDSFYEIQKYQDITKSPLLVSRDIQNLPTKLRLVSSGDGKLTGGGYLELSYTILKVFALTLAGQYAPVPGGTTLIAHFEVPSFDFLRFFGSVYRVNADSAGTALNTKNLLATDNTLIFAGARLTILPVLFLNAQYVRAWLLDQNGTSNSFQISNSLQVNLEVGYEFSHG
jgi:hypothetical protein